MAARPDSPGVEVVYALPDRQRLVEVPLREGMTAWQAIEASGILGEFPELAGQAAVIGIFGQRAEPAHVLRDGDRVEIYRPLVSDPREQRRRRAVAQGRRPGR
jgi:putative ubiquitin-RnfH superfamily antitoxin RatB of RatAB toxin-antitoxin module